MTLKYYFDLMSQPSRALYILLKAANYPFVPNRIALRKGEHFGDTYTAVTRFQKVPVIDHNGFILTESIAIMRYLAHVDIIPERLYPRDTVQRARVDEFLEWQHIGLRLHCAMFFRVKYMDPVLSNTEPNPGKVREYQGRMERALEDLEVKWLGRGRRFIAGDSATVADLFAACEIEQPRMAGYDPSDHYPNIAEWLRSVRQHFDPHYTEAHLILNKVIKKYEQTSGKSAAKL